jgi:hypothetical protein
VRAALPDRYGLAAANRTGPGWARVVRITLRSFHCQREERGLVFSPLFTPSLYVVPLHFSVFFSERVG